MQDTACMSAFLFVLGRDPKDFLLIRQIEQESIGAVDCTLQQSLIGKMVVDWRLIRRFTQRRELQDQGFGIHSGCATPSLRTISSPMVLLFTTIQLAAHDNCPLKISPWLPLIQDANKHTRTRAHGPLKRSHINTTGTGVTCN